MGFLYLFLVGIDSGIVLFRSQWDFDFWASSVCFGSCFFLVQLWVLCSVFQFMVLFKVCMVSCSVLCFGPVFVPMVSRAVLVLYGAG